MASNIHKLHLPSHLFNFRCLSNNIQQHPTMPSDIQRHPASTSCTSPHLLNFRYIQQRQTASSSIEQHQPTCHNIACNNLQHQTASNRTQQCPTATQSSLSPAKHSAMHRSSCPSAHARWAEGTHTTSNTIHASTTCLPCSMAEESKMASDGADHENLFA